MSETQPMIPYGRQSVDQEDIDAVVSVLKSDFLTQGPVIGNFERAVAEFTGVKEVIACNSGTSALHVACLALGLGEGDWLWTTPNTFVASANCALYCGAKVDFVDISLADGNMCVAALKDKLQIAEKQGTLPKIVIPVHYSGKPCDMQEIARLAKQYGFKVVEDACHALGATYQGQAVGSCQYADMAVTSFHPVKMVTTGEGGAVLTNNPELAQKTRLLISHGITKDPAMMSGDIDGPWYYQQLFLGFNYRITDIQSALGLSQMTKLSQFVAKRAEFATRYDEALADLPFVTIAQSSDRLSSHHLYVIRTENKSARLSLFKGLRSAGIGVNVHYIPVHLQPYYQRLEFQYGDLPNAELFYEQAISLPIYPALTNDNFNYIVEVLTHLQQAK